MTTPTQAQIEAAAKVLAADTGLSELVRVPLRKLAEAALTAAAQVGEYKRPENLPHDWEYQPETNCVICHCGFRFGAEHPNGDGTWTCPNCEQAAAQVGEQTKCDYPNCPQWYGGCGPQCRKQAAAQVGKQGKVVNPATVEKLDAIVPTQAQIEAVALALYNNAGAPTETLAKAAISAAARVWEPFTSEGYRALPQYDPETIERCAQVALNNYGMPYEVDERCSRLQILIAAAIRKLKDEP